MKVIARNSNLLGKVVVLVIVGLCVNTALALDGSGTQEDPWRIKSLEDFNDFAADANYWDDYTRLETDVNLAGLTYTTAVIAPDINNANYDFDGTPFTGIFDGNDHKIIDLTINGGSNKYLGLFGYIGYDSEVKNLGIEGGFINGEFCVGGIVGHSYYGSVSNCYYTGDVNGSYEYVGGLVGYVEDGNVSNCYSAGTVSGDYLRVGGIVGINRNGSISDCYTTSDVSGVYAVGGLVGVNSGIGIISNCNSTNSVSGQTDVGGLVGSNYGSVYFCYSKGDVNGTGTWVGGLIGDNDGNVYHCYSTGFVSAKLFVGGLMGYNNGSVSHCYSTGDVNGVDAVGGLMGGVEENGNVSNCYSTGDVNGDTSVGGLIGDNKDGIISNCYSVGDVNGVEYVGGLIGTNLMDINFNSSISNCFWDTDTQTHGVIESIGGNAGTVINVLGLPTAQMQTISTFTDVDWDFINVWNIGENQTYPYLRVYLPSDINKDGIVNFLDIAITANQWMKGVE